MRSTCFVLLLSLAAPVITQAGDEKPLADLQPKWFVNLIEGVDRVHLAPMKSSYFCYTGQETDSFGVRATVGETQRLEFQTAPLPAELNAQRVTFVIPCGPGGEGGKILDVPFLISINDKPAVTIHASVTGTTLWQREQIQALFVSIARDKWGDPFGLLLLSLPAHFVEASKPATIRIEGKPAENLQGSFVMIGYTLGNVEHVTKAGGVAKLVAAAEAPAVVEQPTAKSKGEPQAQLAGRVEQSLCLTGNAPPEQASRNQRVDGQYTYFAARTDAFAFPHFSPFHPAGRETNFDEYPNRAGGWVAFADGKLTDANTRTKIGWPIYLQTAVGMDFVFDLGAEYLIDEIECHASDNHCRNIEVMLKRDDDPRYTTVQTLTDRATFIRGHYPKLTSPQRLPIGGAAARYVRLNACWEAMQCGFSEIQIWGRPLAAGHRPAGSPLAQLNGNMPIATPRELPIPLPQHPILPTPQEMNLTDGEFTLTTGFRIAVIQPATDRRIRTAALLRDDISAELNVTGDIDILDAGQSPKPRSIVLHQPNSDADKLTGIAAQGYALHITPDRIDIHSRDEQGCFYATQTLILLLKSKSATEFVAPTGVIRDWPHKPFRMFATGAVPITPGFLKALGRFKISHFQVYSADLIPQAIAHNQHAEARFVEFVPIVAYGPWASNPQQWTERNPGEKYEQLNPGRINACPSHPEMWKAYFDLLDRAAQCHGQWININMDEMYMPEAGSRWNVCPLCRARNLTGHELMADTIEKIDAHIRSRGKRTMIIDSTFFAAGISHADDTENDWRKSADLLAARGISKHMLVYIWHGLPLAERLHKLGFSVLAWGGVPDAPLADVYLGNFLNLGDSPFRPTNILSMMPMLWSPQHAVDRADVTDALIEHFMPTFNQLWTNASVPSRRPGAEFFTIDLRTVANRTLIDDSPGDGVGWADLGPNYDLRALASGPRTLAGVPFQILDRAVMVHNRFFYNRNLPDRVEIPVNRSAASINFLHTLDADLGQAYWSVRELGGYYFIVYDNGTYEPIELKNAINICKFDGLNTWWDYAPRGKSMARATLVWRGQLGADVEANLYCFEWVNPFPREPIAKIILASPQRPTSANPILLAATAVAPSPADEANPPKQKYPFGPRRAELLYPADPIGKKIDLTRGQLDGDSVWRTDTGIVLRFNPPILNRKGMEIIQPFWITAQCALFDDEMNAGPSTYDLEVCTTLDLPHPRRLTGLRLAGPYRSTFGQSVDRSGPIYEYQIFVSPDGHTFHSVGRNIHLPDEEGPVFLPLPPHPLQHIRIYQRRSREENQSTPATDFGLNVVEIYGEEVQNAE